MPHIYYILGKAQAAQDDKTVPLFSFEYFPPKTDKGLKALHKRVWRMTKQGPLFADLTWGAGGTTSELTLELSKQWVEHFGVEVNMHLTCTNILPESVGAALKEAKAGGIANIVALRGDPPAGQDKWEAVEGGFECALDLVKYIKKEHNDHFGISVSGYPEGHPSSIKKVENLAKLSTAERGRLVTLDGEHYVCHDEDFNKELLYLKEKIDAGGEFIITQLFFDPQVFFAFEKACRKIGINCPIFPGIMPISMRGGFKRMTGFCKTRIPYEMNLALNAATDDEFKALGHTIIVDLCRTLWESGKIPALHFYTLNQEAAVYDIMRDLGIPVLDVEAEFSEEKERVYAKVDELCAAHAAKKGASEPEKKKAKTIA